MLVRPSLFTNVPFLIVCRISAAILSHHVDDFTLVSAFFLFAVGCLNIFLGLIFRAGAKSKRSVTSWRDHAKGMAKDALPTHVAGVPIPKNVPSFVSSAYSDAKEKGTFNIPTSKMNFGFGRQGEKKASAHGFSISKPLESMPKYFPSTKTST